MWRASVVPFLLAALLAPLAATRARAQTREVTLLHWWTAPSELAALDALGDVLANRYPELRLEAVDARSHGGGARIFLAVSAAAAAGNPPDAIFVNGGAPLQPYFDAGLLSPLDALWEEQGLEKVIPPSVRVMSRVGDRYYAVPVDVHRDNLLWFNSRLLDENGIAPDSLARWSDVFAAAEQLRAAGVPHPIQLGSSWTLSLCLEGILAGMGADTYQAFINGEIVEAEDPRLLEAFGILKTLLSYTSPDHMSLTWSQAIQRVAARETALCLMGDWANGEFELAGLQYSKDYGAVPLPGTRGMYGATVDAFAHPRNTRDPEGGVRFLQVTASREGLDAFNAVKGSIPPRTDTDLTRYDAYQRAAIADFKAARVIYPNIAGGTHDAFKGGLDNLMVAFQRDGDVRKAAAAVADMAARSRNKFERAWRLE